MKKILFPLIIILTSCNNEVDFNGRWIILEMTHNGNIVYPNTTKEKFKMSIDPVGYEGAEKLFFNTKDSTATFPGFNSDNITVNFSIKNDTIKFQIDPDRQYSEVEYDLTKKIFLGQYEIIDESQNENIRLKSDRTIIRIINEESLFTKRLDEIF